MKFDCKGVVELLQDTPHSEYQFLCIKKGYIYALNGHTFYKGLLTDHLEGYTEEVLELLEGKILNLNLLKKISNSKHVKFLKDVVLITDSEGDTSEGFYSVSDDNITVFMVDKILRRGKTMHSRGWYLGSKILDTLLGSFPYSKEENHKVLFSVEEMGTVCFTRIEIGNSVGMSMHKNLE